MFVRWLNLKVRLSFCRSMENLGNDFLDYLVDDYYDVANFDDDSSFGDDESQRSSDVDSLDSDFEDDFEMVYCLWLSISFPLHVSFG